MSCQKKTKSAIIDAKGGSNMKGITEEQREIYRLLYDLGITPNYKGFLHLGYALELCAQQPERLQLVTKKLYPDIAKRYQTSWVAVERNIRTAKELIWQKHRAEFEQIAGIPLQQKPGNAQFLAILAYGVSVGGKSLA